MHSDMSDTEMLLLTSISNAYAYGIDSRAFDMQIKIVILLSHLMIMDTRRLYSQAHFSICFVMIEHK